MAVEACFYFIAIIFLVAQFYSVLMEWTKQRSTRLVSCASGSFRLRTKSEHLGITKKQKEHLRGPASLERLPNWLDLT